jgi:alkylation response protein AidB-like acyl-CoA dehydrogenase
MLESEITSRPWYADLRVWAEKHVNPEVEARDREARFDRGIWSALGKSLSNAPCVPKEFGGMGLNAYETALFFEALGYHSRDAGFNFCLAAHTLACTVPIMLFGSEEQKSTYLPKLANGEWMAANAITESSSGSDAFEMNSIAEKISSGYHLKGEKTYVTNAPESQLILVYAKTDPSKGFLGGVSCFLLEESCNEFERGPVESKLGLRSCTMSTMTYDVELPNDRRLGREGRGGQVFHESMLWERGLLPALYLGTLERLLEKTISFVQQRESGGRSISKYQAISHPIVEIKTKLEAARALVRRAARGLDDKVETVQRTSMAKWYTSEVYQSSMVKLHQIHGGGSFRGSNDIERHLRDSMAATLYSGSTEIQKNILAGTLGL